MSTTVKVSDQGQVTPPKPLRDTLGIRPGSRLEFRLAADGVLQVTVLAKGSAALSGPLARPGEAARSLADQDAAVAETVRARAQGRR